jgi:hypothetical protein
MAYKQAKNRRKRLVKTYEETKHKYGSGIWYDEDRGRYIRCTASNTPGYAKILRRICNKKVRKSADVGNFGVYRKSYDYKWTLY